MRTLVALRLPGRIDANSIRIAGDTISAVVHVDPDPALIEVAGLRVDRRGHRAFANDVELKLSRTEWRLLEFLSREPATITPREEILVHVFDREPNDSTDSPKSFAVRLRAKLREALPGHAWIPNSWGRGYALLFDD